MTAGPDLEVVRDFATALFIGALVGIEREQRRLREGFGTIGLRSFVLLAEIGAIAGWLAQTLGPWVLVAGLLAAVAPVIAGYVESRAGPRGLGLTTEFAAVAVCLLGALTTSGQREVAVGLGVVTAALLAYKQPLHGLVAKLGPDDVTAGVRFLLATFIVLPLLPREPVDPWGAIRPYSLWLLVLLISGLSLCGYVATRWLGRDRGLAVTALSGSLVSSTAVTLAFVRQSRDAGRAATTLAGGILLAWGVMFLRVLITVTIVNAALVVHLLPAFAAMTAVSLLLGALYFRRREGEPMAAAGDVPLKNPFSLWSAAKFAGLFALVQLVVAFTQKHFPGEGTYMVAGLAGLTEVDAITLTMAQQARAGVEGQQALAPAVAAIAIALAALSNTLVKCGMALVMGAPPLRRAIGIGTALIVVAGGVVAWLVRPA
jgi:uncharacterized membrane protein (DUF4010 family)